MRSQVSYWSNQRSDFEAGNSGARCIGMKGAQLALGRALAAPRFRTAMDNSPRGLFSAPLKLRLGLHRKGRKHLVASMSAARRGRGRWEAPDRGVHRRLIVGPLRMRGLGTSPTSQGRSEDGKVRQGHNSSKGWQLLSKRWSAPRSGGGGQPLKTDSSVKVGENREREAG